MNYIDRLDKLKSLKEFINSGKQDDILLMLDKEYKKDKWSIVCAVMHWFDVVANYLDSSNLLIKDNSDNYWGNVYLYITAVDIVTKGINDLHKFITNSDAKIFDGENDVFNSNEDDNHYFQNIRAIFGAHPTTFENNGEYIVATYPTPYSKDIGHLRGNEEDWDYYTLLWSKNKSNHIIQKPFGFSFKSVDNYLDKHLSYLDDFYKDINKKIEEYKEKISHKPINSINDPFKQLGLLIRKDKERLNERYSYELQNLSILIKTKISDKENEKIYSKFRDELINTIPRLQQVIQYPEKYDNIDFLNKLIDCETDMDFDGYYYSKLMEYENNIDLEIVLIKYFSDKIIPFNQNISNIKELFCLVKASECINLHSCK